MNHVTSVGLDVHARSIKAASLNYLTGEIQRKSFKNSPAEVAEWILSLERPKAVYESGVTGFHLARELKALGVDCAVGAVSKMQKPAADKRQKTDRKDAEFLARLLATHNIVEVHVPDTECEAARDLSRALEDAREELSAAKQKLSKFLLRHGFCFDETNDRGQRKKAWGKAWWDWLGRIEFEDEADTETLDYYVGRVRSCEAEKSHLGKLVAKHAQEPRWRARVDALRCVKGIETATAFALTVEADAFSRFSSADGFAAWCGLVPSEHSSGEHRAQGGISKTGNKHVRKLLVEAAWHYATASRGPKDAARTKDVPDEVRFHANKAVRRLVDKRAGMIAEKKRPCVANCATARELACWCWAIGCMAEDAEGQRAHR